jgi:hypothetical protein
MPNGLPVSHRGGDRRSDEFTRVATIDAEALEGIQSSSMLSEGRVCLLSLDAVRDRLGPRCICRREPVYEHVQHSLRRTLSPRDFFFRVSETDFLVAQPSVERIAGRAYCLNCPREVLTHFLGEALITDIKVLEITSIAGGRIGARTLDAAAVEAGGRPSR